MNKILMPNGWIATVEMFDKGIGTVGAEILAAVIRGLPEEQKEGLCVDFPEPWPDGMYELISAAAAVAENLHTLSTDIPITGLALKLTIGGEPGTGAETYFGNNT